LEQQKENMGGKKIKQFEFEGKWKERKFKFVSKSELSPTFSPTKQNKYYVIRVSFLLFFPSVQT